MPISIGATIPSSFVFLCFACLPAFGSAPLNSFHNALVMSLSGSCIFFASQLVKILKICVVFPFTLPNFFFLRFYLSTRFCEILNFLFLFFQNDMMDIRKQIAYELLRKKVLPQSNACSPIELSFFIYNSQNTETTPRLYSLNLR